MRSPDRPTWLAQLNDELSIAKVKIRLAFEDFVLVEMDYLNGQSPSDVCASIVAGEHSLIHLGAADIEPPRPMAEQHTSKGNATVVDLPGHTESNEDELRAIVDLLRKALESNEDTGTVLLFRIMKDGSVRPSAASRVVNPPEAVATLADIGTKTLRAAMSVLNSAGEACNCPKCIARRGGVFMNPSTKAEA